MLSTSSFLSPAQASAAAASPLAAGGSGAPASASAPAEGGSAAFGALVSVLVGPASDADEGGHANRGGAASDIEAEQNRAVLETVDLMAADVPLSFVIAPTDAPIAHLPPPALAVPNGILGGGVEISGVEPEPVLGEAVATEEPSSTGDAPFDSSYSRSVQGRVVRWSSHAALSAVDGRVAAPSIESRSGHMKPAALAAAVRGSEDPPAPPDVLSARDGIGLAASDALSEGGDHPATSSGPTNRATEAETATGATEGPAAPNTGVPGPAFHLHPMNDRVTPVGYTQGPVDQTLAPAEHPRVSAALHPASPPLDAAAATGPPPETTRASAAADQLVATGAASAEGPFGSEFEAGDRALRDEPKDPGVARPPTSVVAPGALAAATDESSSAGDSHRRDRRGFAAAHLRNLVADRTATRADASSDGPAGSVAVGLATQRESAAEPIVTPRVEVSSAMEELPPNVVPAASPWAMAEPAALESGLGGAHANQRFTSMLAHAEEFHGPEHVSRQVVRALYLQWRDGVGEAHVQLNPEHLGQVTLSLRVEQGSVAATVVAETETAQRWIESHRDSLQQSLGEQGLKLDRLMVTTSREGRREQEAEAQGQRQRRPTPRRTSQGVFEVRV